MQKILYRLWLPNVNAHGACFNQICQKDQEKIEEWIQDGFVFPSEIVIDTSMGLSMKFRSSLQNVEFCKACEKTFKEWLFSQSIHFGDQTQVELWRTLIDEEEKVE